MAKTLDEFVRDALGGQMMAILNLQAQNEALADRVKALEAAAPARSTTDTATDGVTWTIAKPPEGAP